MIDFVQDGPASRAEPAFTIFDSQMRVLAWSPGLEHLSGIRAQTAVGRELIEVCHDLNAFAVIAGKGDSGRSNAPIQFPSSSKQIERSIQWGPMAGSGGWVSVTRTSWSDESDGSLTLEELQLSTAAFSGTIDADEVTRIALDFGVRTVRADMGVVYLFDAARNQLYLKGSVGYSPNLQVELAAFPLQNSIPLPLTTCFSKAEAMFFDNIEELCEQFPSVQRFIDESGDKAVALIPLMIKQEVVGVISFSYRRPVRLNKSHKVYLRTLAAQCAQAYERARLFELERIARAKAEAERSQLYSILDHIPASIAIVEGPDLKLAYVNKLYRDMAFIPHDRELIGLPLLDAHPELRTQPIMQITEQVVKSGKPFVGVQDVEIVAADGSMSKQYRSGVLLPLLNERNETHAILSYSYDITEQVESRRKIETSEGRLRMTLESSKLGLWEHIPATHQTWVSAWYAPIFGYEKLPEPWTLDRYLGHIHPDWRDSAIERLKGILDDPTQSEFDYEVPIIRGNGQPAWIYDRGQISRDENGKAIQYRGAVLDITHLKISEEAMKRAKEEAENASRAKTAFVANMSHEFRTPLSAILGFVEFLSKDELPLDKRNSYIEGIRRNGYALLKIVEDILDLAKVEAGSVAVEYQVFNPRSLVHDVLQVFADDAAKKGLKLQIAESTSVPERFVSDPIRLRQILLNLVGNAVKFTEKGSVVIDVKIIEDGSAEKLEILVRDSGIGLNQNQTLKLFQPFSQADQSTRRKFGGTGLGLYISRRLAQALGGNVELTRSIQGLGSEFTVTVQAPAEAVRLQAENTKRLAGPSAEPTALKDHKILIVEDTEDIRELIKTTLEEFGAKVELAKDGLEGVACALTGNFDAVLMDLHMPRLDGYSATQGLRQRGYKKPIIAITAMTQAENRVRCFEIGFDAYLTKPLRNLELVATIKRLCRR